MDALNNIHTKNNLHFNGAFLINYNKALPGTRTRLEKIIGENHRQIFDKYNGKKDNVMYILKNSKDFAVANFIKKNELDFVYRPEIDTNERFDYYYPDEMLNYVENSKTKIITKLEELKDFIAENRTKIKARNSYSTPYLILKTLNIETPKKITKNSDGTIKFKDAKSKNLVIISPETERGTIYVYIKPDSKIDKIKRYAFDKNGNILAVYTTPEGISKFYKNFQKAIYDNYHRPPKNK